MDGYTYDVESVELSEHEMTAFGHLVRYSCMPDSQNQLSCFLSLITRPVPLSVQEFAGRQAAKMWRTELRV